MLVVLTVDVEPSIAGAISDPVVNTPLLHEPVWGEVEGRSEGLGFMLRTLGQHGLKSTFFVETAHVHRFSQTDMGGYVEKILDARQDVQMHLHPVWANFRNGAVRPKRTFSDRCDLITQEDLSELIEHGIGQLRRWGIQNPTGLRTGNFSVSKNVYGAMRTAGLSYSSNICVGMNKSEGLNYSGGVYDIDGIVEIPMTCFEDRGPISQGKLRPLQITSCSFLEIKTALTDLYEAGCKIAVILTHPFEFLKWEGFRFSNMRANSLVQARFDRLCGFLAENKARFETVTLEEAAISLKGPYVAPALEGRAMYSLFRSAQNFLNDRFF